MNNDLSNTEQKVEEKKTNKYSWKEDTIQMEVYDNFNELATMQQEWDEFVESVGSEIFLTYDWCRIWWKYYGKNRDLKVFIFYYDSELVGIIPLFFEKIWLGPISVKAIKIVGSDFTLAQFSLPISKRHITETIRKLFEGISKYKWDIMHIGPIAGLCNHYNELKEAFEESLGRSYGVVAKDTGVQTYFQLADDWEKQLARLKKGERQGIRRSYNALSSDSTSVVSAFASRNNFEQIFEKFVNGHQSYWQGMGKLGHFGDWPAAHEFHNEVAAVQLKHNRLRLLEVKSGTQYLGYGYGYKFGDKYFSFLNARSNSKELAKISIGRVVFSEQVKKALDEGVRYIDSMRGKYEHKLRLGGKLYPVRSILISRKRISVTLRVLALKAFTKILAVCYYKIWFYRIAPRLSFKRRPIWKIWIRSRMFA